MANRIYVLFSIAEQITYEEIEDHPPGFARG
jgi:hypothetical protein